MGIDALTLSSRDLLGGVALFARPAVTALPIVSVNIRDRDGRAPFPPSQISEIGGIRVGILGVTGGSLKTNSDYTLAPAETTLGPAVAALKEKADLLILLSTLTPEENTAIAAKWPQLELIISCDLLRGDLVRRPQSQTVIAQTTNGGTTLGELELSWRPDAAGGWRELSSVPLADLKAEVKKISRAVADISAKMDDASEKGKRRLRYRLTRKNRLLEQLQKKITDHEEVSALVAAGTVNSFITRFHKVRPRPGMQAVNDIVNRVSAELKTAVIRE